MIWGWERGWDPGKQDTWVGCGARSRGGLWALLAGQLFVGADAARYFKAEMVKRKVGTPLGRSRGAETWRYCC